MRHLAILALLFLSSCNIDTSHFGPSQAMYPSMNPRLLAARWEFERLKSSDFGSPDHFLIPADSVMRDLANKPHWWSYWKERLNYREDNIPQGIITYYGSLPYDFPLGRSIKRKGSYMHQAEHFSFSKTGQLLAHVDHDSTLFFYDSNDRLRQSTTYEGGNKEDQSIRLYDYDQYGNILWDAVFFDDEVGLYLNHYRSYQYMVCDSGIYAKEDMYFVDRKKVGSLSSSVTYAFFDNEKVRRRELETYTMGATAVTFFSYHKFEGNYYWSKKETHNILGTDPPIVEITERDHLNRITLSKYSSRLGAPKDSTIYLPGNEAHLYHYPFDYPIRDLTKTKFDSFNNPIREERFEFETLKAIKPIRLNETKYDLLENGTWYNFQIKSTDLATNDGYNDEEYGYRQFLNHPVESFNSTYQETPQLIQIIEKHIPEHLRPKK